MAPTGSKQEQLNEELVLAGLLAKTEAKLHPFIRRSCGAASLYKDVLEHLRRSTSDGGASLPCAPEELVDLGELAINLEDLEDVVRWQWQSREERFAAFRKLLSCQIQSPQELLQAVSEAGPGRAGLNHLLEDSGFKALRPETIEGLRQELEVRVSQRLEITWEGSRPLLVTAPHNIYLRRDGQPPHMLEEFTTLIAQRIARQLGGTSLAWSRAEQRRSELYWALARIRAREDSEMGSFLNPRNRDPNYLLTQEVLQNTWFWQMVRLADKWRDANPFLLHLDIHGCRDPPSTPSHLTLGLAAMRHQAESGKGPLTLDKVEAFASFLQAELTVVLSDLALTPRAKLVRVLMPSLQGRGEIERLSGAWPLQEDFLHHGLEAG